MTSKNNIIPDWNRPFPASECDESAKPMAEIPSLYGADHRTSLQNSRPALQSRYRVLQSVEQGSTIAHHRPPVIGISEIRLSR
jgi:hypothetical protein